ncbi:MAG: hypothetical protein DRP54_01965 [Spirochaetes bacterium]|nr:MAG: hypothetical protein DRP54_01965 [Spirochaetota bacterium]
MAFNFSVALCDHVDRFGRSPPTPVPIKCVPFLLGQRIVNIINMETTHDHQEVLMLFLPQKMKGKNDNQVSWN